MLRKDMNVLVLTHHYLKGVGGGVFASRAYINALSCLFGRVTLLCPAKMEDDINSYQINSNVQIIPIVSKISILHKIFNYCIGRISRYYNVFESILETANFDLVVFDNSKASSGLIDIAHKYVRSVITIHHNYEYDYVKDNVSGIIKPLLLYWTRKYEYQAIVKSDLNLTLTEYDKKQFYTKYHLSSHIKIINTGSFEYINQSYKKSIFSSSRIIGNKKKFLITGNLSAKQTYDSLILWFSTYFPILQKECPDYSLTIAGKKPSNDLMDTCRILGITLIPSPVTMADILNEAEIYICPISKGGGIKLRVMDGLKVGLPIVCHEVSARGYEHFVSKGYVIPYHDLSSFDTSIKEVLAKSYNRDEIILEYNKYFSFESGVDRLKEVLLEFLK